MSDKRTFKEEIDAETVRRIGSWLRRADPRFPQEKFIRLATHGLDDLELKARIDHVIGALGQTLPEDFGEAARLVVSAVEHSGARANAFHYWPLIDWVPSAGLHDFRLSMQILRALTPRFSAEFAVRPYIERYPKQAMAQMVRWTRDADEHVRRLASEGCRPRLPWGGQLRRFIDDPAPVLKVLERLKDDPALYVRRSVANNLNDIAKDHPDRVIDVCTGWSEGASDERRWVIERATRTLVKAGHPRVWGLLGYTKNPKVKLDVLQLRPRRVQLGGKLEITVKLRSASRQQQRLVIDYGIHHVKKSGHTTMKMFKLSKKTVEAGELLHLTKHHSIKKVSTRVYYSGEHRVEIFVNGTSVGSTVFSLRV